jgi:hypothetical protein
MLTSDYSYGIVGDFARMDGTPLPLKYARVSISPRAFYVKRFFRKFIHFCSTAPRRPEKSARMRISPGSNIVPGFCGSAAKTRLTIRMDADGEQGT